MSVPPNIQEPTVTQPSPPTDPDLAEALTSVRRIVNADPRDWAANRHDAFLYGVFQGWDTAEAEAEVAAVHGWDEGYLTRLHRLRAAVTLYLLHSSS
jgi:hypothetical protein